MCAGHPLTRTRHVYLYTDAAFIAHNFSHVAATCIITTGGGIGIGIGIAIGTLITAIITFVIGWIVYKRQICRRAPPFKEVLQNEEPPPRDEEFEPGERDQLVKNGGNSLQRQS